MFYIGIQRLDWDDYPTGVGEKIGLFPTKESAFLWLEAHTDIFWNKYPEQYDWSWQFYAYNGYNHSIRVAEYTSDLTSPEHFVELHS